MFQFTSPSRFQGYNLIRLLAPPHYKFLTIPPPHQPPLLLAALD